jgi:hypothetical protein
VSTGSRRGTTPTLDRAIAKHAVDLCQCLEQAMLTDSHARLALLLRTINIDRHATHLRGRRLHSERQRRALKRLTRVAHAALLLAKQHDVTPKRRHVLSASLVAVCVVVYTHYLECLAHELQQAAGAANLGILHQTKHAIYRATVELESTRQHVLGPLPPPMQRRSLQLPLLIAHANALHTEASAVLRLLATGAE